MKRKKRTRTRIILALVALVLVIGLIIGGLTWGRRQLSAPQGEAGSAIRSSQVTSSSITNSVSSSGTLTSAQGESVTIPQGITLASISVEAGDTVAAGDLLATADRTSVLTALAEAQDQLEQLDEQLEDTEDDTPSSTIQAGVSGRVKAIWAEEGDSVSAVTAQEGGLLLLSLDGKLSVTLSPVDGVEVGDSVTVTLSDGETEEGTVESVTDSALTVTLTDNGPAYGDTVTVTGEDGTQLGSGTLAVHSPLLITGYTGTVSSVKVEENEKVSSDTTLFKLEDLGHTAEYDALLVQRQTLAQSIQALTALYQDNRITAPFDGTVQSVSMEAEGSSASSSDTEAMAYPTSSATPAGSVTLLTATLTESEPSQEDSTEEEAAPSSDATDPPASEDTPSEDADGEPTEDTQLPSDSQDSETVTDDTSEAAPSPAVVELEAQVTLTGGDLSTYTGVFHLYLSGEGSTQEQTNDGTGKVTFDPLTFDAPGSYLYRLYQGTGTDQQITYDTTIYTLTIHVTQQGDALQAQVVSTQTPLVFANQLSETTADSTNTEEQPTQESTNQSANLPQGQSGSGGSFSGSVSFSGSGSSGGSSSLTAVNNSSSGSDSTEGTALDLSSTEQVLLTLSPGDTMTVSVSVDELDILSIQSGQEASVTVDALEGDPITGTVTGIDTNGASSGGVTKYTVEVTVEKTDQMLSGMSASVEIAISQAENCLTLPEAALQQDGTRTYVYTTYDEETDTLGGETEVTTGLSDGTNVEITDGLSDGDTVYYPYAEVSDTTSNPFAGMGGMGQMGAMGGMEMGDRASFSREDFSGGAGGERPGAPS